MSNHTASRERPVLGGLIAFGVLAIVLGFLNVRRTIAGVRTPLREQGTDAAAASLTLTREEFEQQQRASLAAQDTDRDGLSDLDEFERTKTSPFLGDSDSDGRTDREEADAGEDPNCPRGTTCGGAPIVPQGAQSGALFPALRAPSAPPQPALRSRGADTPNAMELRRALERQGFPPNLLQGLGDAELLDAYRTSLQSVTQLPTGDSAPVAQAIEEVFAQRVRGGAVDRRAVVNALPSDAPAIRELLSRGGFPRAELDRLDDAALLTLWQHALAEFEREASGAE